MFKLIVLDPIGGAGWRCIVKRGAFATLTSVRAATRAEAVKDAVKQARIAIRCDRDSRRSDALMTPSELRRAGFYAAPGD